MIERIKFFLLRWLLRQHGGQITADMLERCHIYDAMICSKPASLDGLSHDAKIAVVCSDHIFMFYGDAFVWPALPVKRRAAIPVGSV